MLGSLSRATDVDGTVQPTAADLEVKKTFLERNAQVTAIAEGPTPRAGLAVCCSMLGGSGPHSLGYEEIVQGIVDEIAKHPARYPTIDTQRVIVQQLHRLSDRQVRAAARQLMVRWDLFATAAES